MSMKKTKKELKTRSWVAVSAQMRNSAGSMGGTKRTKNRKDRKASKQALRSLYI
jgi:hypothetical protein